MKLSEHEKVGYRTMSKEQSLFEKLGGTYTEIDGLFYPNLVIGQTENVNIFSGKFGDLWKQYMKENHPERYRLLVHLGTLNQTATEVNENSYERMDVITAFYKKKHQAKDSNSTMEMWRINQQANIMAEEIVLHEIVYCYR